MAKKSRRKKTQVRIPVVIRTFEGLPQEGDLIALREFVSSGSASITLNTGQGIRLVTSLPGAASGLVREDGEVWVALQVAHNHGDVSREIVHIIESAANVESGGLIKNTPPAPGTRLQELITPGTRFDIQIHDDFEWWLDESEAKDPEVRASLQAVNETIWPSVRLESVESAWVTAMGEHRYLRWVMTDVDEDQLLNAFSRLRARGEDAVSNGTELIGMFRAYGVLVPVWELNDVPVDELEKVAPQFRKVLDQALVMTEPLTSAERSTRQELVSRQVTIR